MKNNNQRGAITAILIAIVVIAMLGGGAVYYVSQTNAPEIGDSMEEKDTMVKTTPAAGEVMEKKDSDAMMEQKGTTTYSGTVLAGTTSPLLDFTQADYEATKNSGKLVALYFYADWCPICRAEFPKMQAVFNQLNNPNVVGFRVNYNDNATDDVEKSLAREFGVAYQHTKVFVKNGQQVLKSPETWETDRYITEITNAAR